MNRELIQGRGQLFAHSQEIDGQLFCNIMGYFDLAIDANDESLTPCLVRDGYWESWITLWVWNNVAPESLFIDAGANCGYYTMLAYSLGATVISYEPNPRYVSLLKQTREHNGATFDIREVALADKEGTLPLSIPGALYGSASVVADFSGWETHQSIVVDVTALDSDYDAYQSDVPYILKMDVEGAEELVWDGAQDLLNSDRPGIVMVEWTPDSYSPGFFDKLQAYGEVMLINGNGEEEPVEISWLSEQQDWVMLAVRKR